MKHVVVCEFGSSLGVTSERMTVKCKGELVAEFPLARLHTVTVAKQGVSLSSNLVQECATRGIRLFFLNGIGECVASLSGIRSHGVGMTRRHQILFLEDSKKSSELAMRVTYGKIRNQRATLCYFAKSENFRKQGVSAPLIEAADALKSAADNAFSCWKNEDDCRSSLLGIEGSAASIYWKAWIESGLLPQSFEGRSGRGGKDPMNAALNYGYGVLGTYVWNAVLVAGLEPFLGFYHVQRPGKPSLVLDMIEEYRAWCVDRIVIKNRASLSKVEDGLDLTLRKRLISEIQNVFSTQYPCKGKKLSLESILQRQVYRLVGHFAGQKNYKPYLFKW